MARSRRTFSDEFKQEAVRLVQQRGVSMAQAARNLDLHVNLLRGWVRTATSDAAAADRGRPSARVDQAEVTRLRKEVTKLRMERDILKNAAVDSMGQCNTHVAGTHGGTTWPRSVAGDYRRTSGSRSGRCGSGAIRSA